MMASNHVHLSQAPPLLRHILFFFCFSTETLYTAKGTDKDCDYLLSVSANVYSRVTHYGSQNREHFQHSGKIPSCAISHIPATTVLTLTIRLLLPGCKRWLAAMLQHSCFCIWFPSRGAMFLRLTQVVCVSGSLLLTVNLVINSHTDWHLSQTYHKQKIPLWDYFVDMNAYNCWVIQQV